MGRAATATAAEPPSLLTLPGVVDPDSGHIDVGQPPTAAGLAAEFRIDTEYAKIREELESPSWLSSIYNSFYPHPDYRMLIRFHLRWLFKRFAPLVKNLRLSTDFVSVDFGTKIRLAFFVGSPGDSHLYYVGFNVFFDGILIFALECAPVNLPTQDFSQAVQNPLLREMATSILFFDDWNFNEKVQSEWLVHVANDEYNFNYKYKEFVSALAPLNSDGLKPPRAVLEYYDPNDAFHRHRKRPDFNRRPSG